MKKYPKPDELFKFDLDNMKLEDENFRVLIKRECQKKNMVNFENKCFCGIGETLDSRVIHHLNMASLLSNHLKKQYIYLVLLISLVC